MSNILDKAQEWVNETTIDQADREEIQQLIDQNNQSELTERFYRDLEFGTGGLRAILGNGSNRISKYTIRRATQAFSNTLIAAFKSPISVAISFDSRKNSDIFAQEAATVFAVREYYLCEPPWGALRKVISWERVSDQPEQLPRLGTRKVRQQEPWPAEVFQYGRLSRRWCARSTLWCFTSCVLQSPMCMVPSIIKSACPLQIGKVCAA